jgi:hypothetical protein
MAQVAHIDTILMQCFTQTLRIDRDYLQIVQ